MKEHYRSERHYALERNYPSCSGGSCAQGSGRCVTPQACEVSPYDAGSWLTLVIVLIGTVGMVALMVWQ